MPLLSCYWNFWKGEKVKGAGPVPLRGVTDPLKGGVRRMVKL